MVSPPPEGRKGRPVVALESMASMYRDVSGCSNMYIYAVYDCICTVYVSDCISMYQVSLESMFSCSFSLDFFVKSKHNLLGLETTGCTETQCHTRARGIRDAGSAVLAEGQFLMPCVAVRL